MIDYQNFTITDLHSPPAYPLPITELGPGKVIAGVLKRIDKTAEISNVEV
jgi:hypothetical protein